LGVTTPSPRRRLECWELAKANPEALEGLADGVLEDWTGVGVGLPCDCGPEAPSVMSLELGCKLGPVAGVLSSSIAFRPAER
jgi:hypothetical protein